MIKSNPQIAAEEQAEIVVGLIDALVELCPPDSGMSGACAAVLHQAQLAAHQLRSIIHDANNLDDTEATVAEERFDLPLGTTGKHNHSSSGRDESGAV